MTAETVDPNDRTEKIALTVLMVSMIVINLFLVYLAVTQDDTIVSSYQEEAR